MSQWLLSALDHGKRSRDLGIGRDLSEYMYEGGFKSVWLAAWDARDKELREGTMGEQRRDGDIPGHVVSATARDAFSAVERDRDHWKHRAEVAETSLSESLFVEREQDLAYRAQGIRQKAIELLPNFVKPSEFSGGTDDHREALVLRIARFLETGSFDDQAAKEPKQAIAVGAMIPSNKES